MNPPVPRLKNIRVGDAVLDLDRLLNADYDNVSEASEKLPAAISWLVYQRALMVEQVALCDRQEDQTKAEVYFALKGGGFESAGYGSKPTDTAIKMAMLLDPGVKAAGERMAKFQRYLALYTGQIDALKAKLELVRTSEATRRRLIETPTDESIERMARNQTPDEEKP
jgi:hypothetical protein